MIGGATIVHIIIGVGLVIGLLVISALTLAAIIFRLLDSIDNAMVVEEIKEFNEWQEIEPEQLLNQRGGKTEMPETPKKKKKEKMSLPELYWAGYNVGYKCEYELCPYPDDPIATEYWEKGRRDGESAYYDD